MKHANLLNTFHFIFIFIIYGKLNLTLCNRKLLFSIAVSSSQQSWHSDSIDLTLLLAVLKVITERLREFIIVAFNFCLTTYFRMDVERIFSAEQIQVHPDLSKIIREYTKAVIRENPAVKIQTAHL